MESNGLGKPSVRKVFKKTDFQKLWLSQLVNNIGTFMSLITFPLYSYYITGNELWLGIIAIVELIPTILFSPLAGMVVDSFERKKIMIFSNLLGGLFIVCIPLLTTFSNIKNKDILMIGFCFIILMISVFQRFFIPAEDASLPTIVEKDEIDIAVSITQTTFHLVLVIAPVLAILIIQTIGYGFVFLVDSSTYVSSSIMIFLIKKKLKPERNSKNTDYEKPSILLGTKKIFFSPALRFVTFLSIFMAFGSILINSFMVAYAIGTLKMTNSEFGIALSLVGISGIVSGLILTTRVSKISNPLLMFTFGMFLNGCIWILAGINTKIWVLYLILALGGTVNILTSIPSTIVLMQETSDTIRGQVFSSFGQISKLSNIVGITIGTLIEVSIGVRNLFLLSGLIQFIPAIIGFGYLFLIFEQNDKTLNQNIDNIDIVLD